MIGRRRAGDVIARTAGELLRVWRAARQRTPGTAAGRIDGLAGPFLVAAGEALARGDTAANVAARLAGVVRLDHADAARSRRELDAEWALLGEVLASAVDAFGAEPPARRFLAEAVEAARAATQARGARPLVVVWQWSGGPGPGRTS